MPCDCFVPIPGYLPLEALPQLRMLPTSGSLTSFYRYRNFGRGNLA
ncbi:MAG: hypothetical protein RJA70_537 [Pseudomonadota bacterium]|jgi:hypothetical protein